MTKAEENPVSGDVARAELGKPGPPIGRTRFSAIKAAMKKDGKPVGERWVFLSAVREWLRANPNFHERQIYHRKGCICEECRVKKLLERSQPDRQVESAHKSDAR